ncbi:MAG: PLP-dependent transferase, partial [Nitrososphaera sp.]|nr:PLP-dependent transferase [Nitrososphaera sp.]
MTIDRELMDWSPETQLVHGAYPGESDYVPEDQIAFPFKSCEEAMRVFSGEQTDVDVYARIRHPMQRALAERCAILERAPAAHVASSGEAVIFETLTHYLINKGRNKPWWVSGEKMPELIMPVCMYGGTIAQAMEHIAAKVVFIKDIEDLSEWARAMRPRSGVVKVAVVEVPDNPLIKICNVPAIAEIAERCNVTFLVDNTVGLASFRPLKYGATAVFASTTKYLAAWIGGMVAGPEEDIKEILLKSHRHTGGCMSPDIARRTL